MTLCKASWSPVARCAFPPPPEGAAGASSAMMDYLYVFGGILMIAKIAVRNERSTRKEDSELISIDCGEADLQGKEGKIRTKKGKRIVGKDVFLTVNGN